MKNSLYPKLAFTNIKKNGKFYIPYMITCIISIAMLYQMSQLRQTVSVSKVSGVDSLTQIFGLGFYVIAIFTFIMLFYTNSFLIKQRKKELGLFNILGMGKKHISIVMIIESIYVYTITIVSGLTIGILFSKLVGALLMKMLKYDIPFEFSVNNYSIMLTIIFFSCIFLLTTIYNIAKVQLSKPIELLHGKNVGEKEPRTKYVLTVIGVLTLGLGYYIAVTTENPLKALTLFFVAVILVIIGTYCLFTAGTIAILKALRKNKNYYYKTKNFVSVSNMIYRMKQNAVGLANICILSTTILVMISTTVCLYFGSEDSLRVAFPRNVETQMVIADEQKTINDMSKIKEIIKKQNLDLKNEIEYKKLSTFMEREGKKFKFTGNESFFECVEVNVVSIDSYNRVAKKKQTLKSNEVLLFTNNKKFEEKYVNIHGNNFKIKDKLKDSDFGYNPVFKTYTFVVKDENLIEEYFNTFYNIKKGIAARELTYGFDLKDTDKQVELTNQIQKHINENIDLSKGGTAKIRCVQNARQTFLNLYGGLFFLGIYLGLIFIVATVLIMYYKQISEGYNDKERFEIMKKVGMEKKEIKKIIHSQVLMVFFMPLIAAAIHVGFSFNITTKMIGALGMTNIPLFILATIATIIVFAIFYAIIYFFTAKVYYKIVE